MSNSAIVLVGRVLLAVLFIMAGLQKLGAPGATAGYMASMGVPLSSLTVWLVIALEVLGGLAILVGFMTAPAAYLLALLCVASGFLAHFNFEDQIQAALFMKNIAIAGGFLVLAAHGPGSLSVDARRGG